MYVTIDTKTLRSMLRNAKRRIAKSQSIPMLRHVKLSANLDWQTFSITATDLKLYGTETVPAKVEYDSGYGACCVGYEQLAETVKGINTETVTIKLVSANDNEHRNERLYVNNAALYTMPVDDFPDKPPMETPDWYTCVTLSCLVPVYKQMLPVLKTVDRSRASLLGIRHEFYDNSLFTLIATDGCRMIVKRDLPHRAVPQKHRTFTLPIYTVQDIVGLYKKTSANKDITFFGVSNDPGTKNPNEIKGPIEMRIGNLDDPDETNTTTITSYLVDKRYPNWQNIMPTDNTYNRNVTLDINTFLSAIKCVSPMCDKRLNCIYMVVDSEVTLYAYNSEVGVTEYSIPYIMRSNDNNMFRLAFNYKYMEDALKGSNKRDGTTVTIQTNMAGIDTEEALNIVVPGTSDQVLMPIRMSDKNWNTVFEAVEKQKKDTG